MREEAATKLKTLLDAGVNHFIDLTQPGELISYAEFVEQEAHHLGLSAGYERHPIDDMGVPCRPERMADILDAIDAALSDGKTIYVHCWGGVGRTGTVVGCWLVRHGDTGEAALDQIAEWWRRVEKAWRMPKSPETSDQREYVRDWTDPS